MRFRTFVCVLLALLLAPLAVVAGFAAYVHRANGVAQTGPLQTGVYPQVVWPWQDAAYLLTVRATPKTDAPPAPPIDMVFVIDVSGSMQSSMSAMAEAAHALARELAFGRPDQVRFALIRFDTEAEIKVQWTSDPEALYADLRELRPITGQTEASEAFARLEEALASARSEATPVAVWYTDGLLTSCSFCETVMSEDEIVAVAEKLRAEGGVEIYSVGRPGHDSHSLMVDVTGSRERVFDPASARDLGRSFRFLATSLLGSAGSGGRLSQRLDGRHFRTPLAGTDWHQDAADGTLVLDFGPVSERAVTYAHPLVPRSAGLWRVGLDPPRLTYIDDTDTVVDVRAERRPALLVITWLALLLAALPALLWALLNRPRHRPETAVEPLALPPIRRLPAPRPLPALPPASATRHAVIPTLFLGLGGAGRRALHAIRAELKQAHLGAAGQPPICPPPGEPYDFLWIDLDHREQQRDLPFDAWPEHPIAALVAPPEIARAGGYLPAPGAVPAHWQWFDAARYHDAAREDLNLTDGARGDRTLARLALFRWLEQGDLLAELRRRCELLAARPSADGNHQVVVVASHDGGWGSGTFLDLGRLLQRLGRHLQSSGQLAFTPEVVGILCDSAERSRPENRTALGLEIQSAMMTGGFPASTCYRPGDSLLDRVDTEAPFHGIFHAAGPDDASIAAQAAGTVAVLVDRRPRGELVEAAGALSGGAEEPPVVEAGVRSVQVVPTLVQEQVTVELLLRILGPDVLLDIEPTAGGGFAPRAVSETEAARLLAAWAASEPAGDPPLVPLRGNPLQLLLAAARDPAAGAGLATVLARTPEDAGEWYREALADAINRRLHGHREGTAWQRDWTPAAAVATLRLLARRLGDDLGTDPAGHRLQSAVAGLAESGAEALESWLRAFCRACEPLARRRQELAARLAQLQKLAGRTTLATVAPEARSNTTGAGEPTVDRAREALEQWLGTQDTTSLLRERLFFATIAAGDRLEVGLRSFIAAPATFIAAPATFTATEQAVTALSELTRALARGLPATRLGHALARLDDDERQGLARGLVDRATRTDRVLLVAPETAGDDPGSRTLTSFCRAIPQPADHGERTEVASGDPSAVRRVELQRQTFVEGTAPCYVAAAEQEAERVRQRLERTFQLDVPPLPPALRIALARPRSFRSFARAYWTGHVVRRRDHAGAEQWFFADDGGDGRFLTYGSEATLAAAAAEYVLGIESPADDFPQTGPGGDFSALERWRRFAGLPEGDVPVLAAIEICAGT